MRKRRPIRPIGVLLLAAAITAAPGRARMADPPAAESQVVGGRAGLICLWAIYTTMEEVGRRCGSARNVAFEAELQRSAARIEDYARRQSPTGAAFMTDYRARRIEGAAQLCAPDALAMYRQMAQAPPEAVRGEADRLLASSPPLEWGACL